MNFLWPQFSWGFLLFISWFLPMYSDLLFFQVFSHNGLSHSFFYRFIGMPNVFFAVSQVFPKVFGPTSLENRPRTTHLGPGLDALARGGLLCNTQGPRCPWRGAIWEHCSETLVDVSCSWMFNEIFHDIYWIPEVGFYSCPTSSPRTPIELTHPSL